MRILLLLSAFVFACAGNPAVTARTLSIVASPDLAPSARHGLAKFEAAVRARSWEIEEAVSAKAARGDAIVFAVLADSFKTLPIVPAPTRPLKVPEALAVKKFSLDGKANEYAATIPGEFLKPEWDAMYFLEAIDGAGNGAIWPDFRREAPYVFVKLQR